MKKLRNALLIFAGIFLLFFIAVQLIFQNYNDEPAEILSFHPTGFDIDGGAPFFYTIDHKLHYCTDGVLNFKTKPIWDHKLHWNVKCQVSPDGRYIAIADKKSIFVLDHTGDIVSELSPIENHYEDDGKLQKGFHEEGFQWSADSKRFFIVRDIDRDSPLLNTPIYAIFQLSIPDRRLTELRRFGSEFEDQFFFDSTYTTLYYRVVENGEFYFDKVELPVNGNNSVPERLSNPIYAVGEPVFVNYRSERAFSRHGNYWFEDMQHGADRGYYFRSDSGDTLLFPTKLGYGAFKGGSHSFDVGPAGYFPNDKFYYTVSVADNLEGTIFFDMRTLEYTFRKVEFERFFSVTTADFPEFKSDYFGFVPAH